MSEGAANTTMPHWRQEPTRVHIATRTPDVRGLAANSRPTSETSSLLHDATFKIPLLLY